MLEVTYTLTAEIALDSMESRALRPPWTRPAFYRLWLLVPVALLTCAFAERLNGGRTHGLWAAVAVGFFALIPLHRFFWLQNPPPFGPVIGGFDDLLAIEHAGGAIRVRLTLTDAGLDAEFTSRFWMRWSEMYCMSESDDEIALYLSSNRILLLSRYGFERDADYRALSDFVKVRVKK